MEIESPQPPESAAEAGPLYLTNRDPDDETDADEVDDGPDLIAA